MNSSSSEQQINQPEIDGLDALWEITQGRPEIHVAVLDGPVNPGHPDLQGMQYDYIHRSSDRPARSSHGTFVTSLIAAGHQGNVKGIAPGCRYLFHDLYHETAGGGLYPCGQADIARGVLNALHHGAHLINISGGERMAAGGEVMPCLADALSQCEAQGVLVIAATGNDGSNVLHAPACYPTVLAVGSLDKKGLPSAFSNWHEAASSHGITITGEQALGACVDGDGFSTCTMSGTSFSTAYVSGIAALIASWQQQYGMSDMLSIRQLLLDCATPSLASDHPERARVLAGKLDLEQVIDTCRSGFPAQAGTPESGTALAAVISSNHLNDKAFAMNQDTFSDPNASPASSGQDGGPAHTTEPSHAIPASAPDDVSVTQAGACAAQSDDAPGSNIPCNHEAIRNNANSPAPASQNHMHYSGVRAAASGAVKPASVYNPFVNQGNIPTFENCQLVLAIGQPSYNFGIEANQDVFKAALSEWHSHLPEVMKTMFPDSPYSELSMAGFLLWHDSSGNATNLYYSSQLIWILSMNATPVYSITPGMVPFSDSIYFELAAFLAENVGLDVAKYKQLSRAVSHRADGTNNNAERLFSEIKTTYEDSLKNKNNVMRMSLPGYISGETRLLNGNAIQSVSPVAYGMNNWTLEALIDAYSHGRQSSDNFRKQLESLLNRLYINTVNRGQSPEERALNYAIYNIISVADVVNEAAENNLQFTSYQVKPSKIQRQHSEMRDVELTFFDPGNTTLASTTYAITVDVSAITPIIVGQIEQWHAPVSVTSV
ncbi:S8 family serine peptidase [Vibrio quintilis]|uniref:Thermophilic serine proteinase n=1 Tax=Vibrio quintilis TaxID=1117707 RepID=A0A1M7Z1B7_9VIBR|nr:S8 family serine peptidase [Vibrio quintilis]SHO58651.1 Thermophilic serine proteinase precursor [Vibrio quintilis]